MFPAFDWIRVYPSSLYFLIFINSGRLELFTQITIFIRLTSNETLIRRIYEKIIITALLGFLSSTAHAVEEYKVDMKNLTTGKSVGYVTVTPAQYGVVFTPHLKGLDAGLHGFHVHANPSCGTSKVNGKNSWWSGRGALWPWQNKQTQHPLVNRRSQGRPTCALCRSKWKRASARTSPKLTMDDLKGRSLMIHVGGDNHSDHPAPLGGGGGRIVCGVF